MRALAIDDGILDQVRDRAFERDRLHLDHRRTLGERGIDLDGDVVQAFDAVGDELGEIHLPARLRIRVLARERQRLLDHGLHLVEIAQHLLALLLIFDEFRAQLQARDRRPEIVGERA